MDPEGFVACLEGQNGFFVDSTSLIVHGKFNHIIVAFHHMFTPTD